jgi:1-deoxy-D-xylulose-5-phosphate reductoisomerase
MDTKDINTIALLGSTGSIGMSALDVIASNPERYRVVSLSAGRNIKRLAEQMSIFRPLAVSVLEEKSAEALRRRFSGDYRPRILWGVPGFIEAATMAEVRTVISAMSGAAGLLPTYEAIRNGKQIALANKETMVTAGPLIMETAEKKGVSIRPIDSEHSAVFQSLQGHDRADLKRIILTASGGPFRDMSLAQMKDVTPEQALDHPNWSMGRKISIDSATLMNKGLEAIEAMWLFGLKKSRIDIVIHPQSIIHSMVEYKDGSTIAQLGVPDMKIPISYALSYPRHLGNGLETLQLTEIGALTFEAPDMDRFRCLKLALEAAEAGGSVPAVLNGANEVAVGAFLEGRIGFLDIPALIEKSLDMHDPFPIDTIERVTAADTWARKTAEKVLGDIEQ